MQEHDTPNTRAWVIHPDLKTDHTRRDAIPALAEAVALAAALPNLQVVGSDVVRLPKIHAGMLLGKGKIEELRVIFEANEVELVLIDGPVTPVQQRNLEKAWGVKLLDRTGLGDAHVAVDHDRRLAHLVDVGAVFRGPCFAAKEIYFDQFVVEAGQV